MCKIYFRVKFVKYGHGYSKLKDYNELVLK